MAKAQTQKEKEEKNLEIAEKNLAAERESVSDLKEGTEDVQRPFDTTDGRTEEDIENAIENQEKFGQGTLPPEKLEAGEEQPDEIKTEKVTQGELDELINNKKIDVYPEGYFAAGTGKGSRTRYIVSNEFTAEESEERAKRAKSKKK